MNAGPQLLLELHQVAPRIRKTPSPAYRKSDPVTSRLAAELVTRSGKRKFQQELVLSIVREHPGLTSMELSKVSSKDRSMIARRLPDLRDAGLVWMSTKPQLCSINKTLAYVWFPVKGEI